MSDNFMDEVREFACAVERLDRHRAAAGDVSPYETLKTPYKVAKALLAVEALCKEWAENDWNERYIREIRQAIEGAGE